MRAPKGALGAAVRPDQGAHRGRDQGPASLRVRTSTGCSSPPANEAWLPSIGEDWDPMRMNGAIRKISRWYRRRLDQGRPGTSTSTTASSCRHAPHAVGDPRRAGGPQRRPSGTPSPPTCWPRPRRAQRFAEHLERFIGPEGAATRPSGARSPTTAPPPSSPWPCWLAQSFCPSPCLRGRCAALHAAHVAIWGGPSNLLSGYLNIGFGAPSPSWATGTPTTAACTSHRPACLCSGLPA